MRTERSGRLVVAGLLAAGVLASWLAMRARQSGGTYRDPVSLLPATGFVLALDGPELGRDLLVLRRTPLFRALLATDGAKTRSRAFGWKEGVPDPISRIPATGPAALGIYGAGWAVVARPGSGAGSGTPSRRADGFERLASSRELLEDRSALAPGSEPVRPGSLFLRLDLATWLRTASSGRRGWASHAPVSASGRIQVTPSSIEELWRLECGDACFLDLLVEEPAERGEALGWPAVPENAVAVEWMRVDPGRLASWTHAPAKAGGVLERLARVEAFLGVSVRDELSRALAGPCLVASERPRPGEPVEPILLFDLADPGAARRVLDRVVALGIVSGSMMEESYRGIPIASWTRRSARGGPSPSAAVDGDLLIVGFRRAAVADAIDRRRAPDRRAAVEPLRRRLDALGRGSWKAFSASGGLVEAWESFLGLPSGFAPSDSRASGVLARERGAWILHGKGNSPALTADSMLLAVRRLAGTLRLESPGDAR